MLLSRLHIPYVMNSSPGTPFLKVFLRRYLTAAPREAADTMGNQAVGAGLLVLNARLVRVVCLPDCIELSVQLRLT